MVTQFRLTQLVKKELESEAIQLVKKELVIQLVKKELESEAKSV